MSHLREDQGAVWARQPRFVLAWCYQGAMGDEWECRECREGLEHCHGTVIHHALRRSECTEDGCVTPEVVHAFSIDCEAIGCTCAEPRSAHRVS